MLLDSGSVVCYMLVNEYLPGTMPSLGLIGSKVFYPAIACPVIRRVRSSGQGIICAVFGNHTASPNILSGFFLGSPTVHPRNMASLGNRSDIAY